MRILDDSLLLKLLKHDLSISSILSFSRMDIGHIEPYSAFAPNICFVDASHNNLKSVDAVWFKLCPSAWWIDASFNQITEINMELLPYAMGSLNLSSNSLLLRSLQALRSTYILRLTLLGSSDTNCSILSNLNPSSYRPRAINLLINTWVLDDKFISHMERLISSKYATIEDDEFNHETPSSNDDQIRQQWGTRIASERETSIMRLVQCIPLDGASSDHCRLEVLLEDYLEEARLIAAFNRSHLSCGKTKMSSTSVNMLQLLSIPHKVRLDLSVLLTSSVLFSLPKQLLKDTLVHLLSSHIPLVDIHCYCSLPSFINTAVVSVIRRICHRELQELAEMHTIPPKPTCKEFPKHTNEYLSGLYYSDQSEDPVSPTYIGSLGFNHLQPFKRYLERPISEGIYNTSGPAVPSENAFSSLELEILNTLPDVPCMCFPTSSNEGNIKWLGIAARHTILLMSAAPGFPCLSKTLRNKVDQGLCDQLAPVLEAARIGISEIEVELGGSEFDSRSTLNGDRGLRFGAGLPAGKPEELFWRKHSMQGVMKQKTKKILELETDNFSPGSTGDWTPVKLPSTAHLIRPPSFNLGHHCEDELGPLLRSVSARDDFSITSERHTSTPIKAIDHNLLDLDDPLLGQFFTHNEASQEHIETEKTGGSSLTPSQPFNDAQAYSGQHHHGTDSSLKDRTGDDISEKSNFMESKVLGSLVGHVSGGARNVKVQGDRKNNLPEKQSFWDKAGRAPVTVGAEVPDPFSRMHYTAMYTSTGQSSTRAGSAVPRMRLGDTGLVRERAMSRDRMVGMDQREDEEAVRRKLLLEMGTLRNIRQLNDGFSEKFCSSLKVKNASKLGNIPGDWMTSVSKASDCAFKSAFVLARAHTAAPSSRDASNYGRMKGESCRDMVLMRGSSSGGVRRLSLEKDGKNNPSGNSMTLENGDRGDRGGRDHCNDLRERSISDLSVLSVKASDRVTERHETSLSEGVEAPLTAETSRTPHGKCTESQATRLSPTPLTRASVPLTSQSFNILAATSDVTYPDTEVRMDSATSLTDCLTDSHSASVADQTQNQTRSDALVCTGHVRTRVQTAPSYQSGAINGSGGEIVPLQVRDFEATRGPGSLVISGRGQGVSGTGTNIARHRAATHKLSITHNYRCMYQSQRMKSSVYKKPESEGLGYIVKVLNYNTSLPQKPKELIKK